MTSGKSLTYDEEVIARIISREVGVRHGWMLDGLEDAARKIAAALSTPPVEQALRNALRAAADKFAEYAELHLAKGTRDGILKAQANAAMATLCETALSTSPPSIGDECEELERLRAWTFGPDGVKWHTARTVTFAAEKERLRKALEQARARFEKLGMTVDAVDCAHTLSPSPTHVSEESNLTGCLDPDAHQGRCGYSRRSGAPASDKPEEEALAEATQIIRLFHGFQTGKDRRNPALGPAFKERVERFLASLPTDKRGGGE